jgi:hypothetical protein
MGNVFNNGPKILKLIVRVRIYQYQRTPITIDYYLNDPIMSSLLIFKYLMSRGTMKLTLKANVCSGLTLTW